MFHTKRSARWRYRKCYFLLSTFSVCLIIFYCIISRKQNLMLLTFLDDTNFSNSFKNNGSGSSNSGSSSSNNKTNIQQNLSKKHVVDSNKQLRDWHISTETQQQQQQYLQVTRDHPQTSTSYSSNTQQQQEQQRLRQQYTANRPQNRILSFDTSKFGQTAIITNSTYNLKLIEYKNTRTIINKNSNNNNSNNYKNSQMNNYNGKKLQLTGFNVELSERLPLQRLIPDTRHESCKTKLYTQLFLPQCSIVIVYHNEHLSVLSRTIYSVIDRTPAELLREILLVNDCSERNNEIEKLLEKKYFEKVHLINLPKREGLIRARLQGARKANGEVLVFLDAHVEVNANWLPPLLVPIAEYAKSCTTPIIDIIRYDTLEYQSSMPSRGGFNWQFNYVQLPLLPQEEQMLPLPHNNPIMNGGLFAIRKDYFWSLGGYDEGLEIWGGEQFEMSFKIWLCGGRLLEVPCSRVGHLYRDPEFKVNYTNRKDDFISKNYKRVAEVWLDEYKEFLYEHIPKLTQINAGNLRPQKRLRKQLNCQPFKWFFDNIAPDLLKAYPPIKPADFASGAIQSLAEPKLCLDLGSTRRREIVREAVKACSPDLQYPYATQKFHLSFRHDLRHQDNCLEVQSWSSHAPIWLWPCHNLEGNQYWYYDRNTQMLVQGKTEYSQLCLELDGHNFKIFANYCNFAKKEQKWHFGYVNQTAMKYFFKN